MKSSINLIIRKRWHEKYFIPLCLLIMIVMAVPLGIMVHETIEGSRELERLAIFIEQKETAVHQLQREKTADELAVRYDQLLAAVEQQQLNRTDWPTSFDAIVKPLVSISNFRLAETEREGELRLHLRFNTYDDIDRYVHQLEQSGLFDVHLQSIKHESENRTESAPYSYYAVTINLTIQHNE